jgi:uncharacterized membrane protein YkoI
VRLSQRGSKPFYISESGRPVNFDQVISSAPASQGAQHSRKGTFRELPTAVQNTVRGQAGIARVEDIDIVTRNGQTNYNVAFKREGKTVELWIDGQGNLLPDGQATAVGSAASQPRTHLAAGSKATFEELPGAVQNTLRTYSQGARIEDIDKGTLQGRTVYEAAFKHQGKNIELRVAEDGKLVRDEVNDRFLAEIGQAPGGAFSAQSAASTPGASWASAPQRVPLSSATKVSFRELPSPVRDTIRTYAGTSRLEDIDKGNVGGQTVYQAAFKHGDQHVELRVTEDGALVRDQANERFISQFNRQTPAGAVGRAPSWQILTGTGSGQAQLLNARPFAFGQLPIAVQNRMRAEAGATAIEDIQRGTLNGKTVYQATVQRDGRNVPVRVTEDGTLVP